MKRVFNILALLLLSVSVFANGAQDEGSSSDVVSLEIYAVEAAAIPIDFDNLPVWEGVEAATGVDITWEMINTDAKEASFNLRMASGDLPDVMAYYDGQGGFESIDRFGGEGAFIALEDLIAQNAPNLNSALLEDNNIKEQIIAQDGHIYRVPMLSAINAARGWFIRYDWLEKLNLDVPTTTDELFDVLMAFKTQDPNGNGLNDEVPMVTRRRGDDAFYNLSALAYAFDADPSWVLRGDTIVYGPSEDAYLDYLDYMVRLYDAGLIDREFLTRTGNPRNELLGKDVAGCLHDWFASTAGLNDTLSSEISGFNLRHMAPPVGTAAEPYTRIQMSTVRTDGGWAITSTNENPVETIKMMDFLYSPEGILLTNFGAEGIHYTMQNGSPVYTDFITDNPEGKGMHEALVSIGAEWKVGMVQSVDYEGQFANQIAFEARKDYQDNYIIEEFPRLSFTVEEQDVLTDKLSQIDTYVAETTARAVVGAMSEAEYKNAFAELDNMGLEEVTAIYQAAYDRK